MQTRAPPIKRKASGKYEIRYKNELLILCYIYLSRRPSFDRVKYL